MTETAPRGRGRPTRTTDMDPELRKKLRATAKRIAQERAQLRHSEQERNLLIHQAIAEGWSHAQIAEEAGVSRGRIGQMSP